MTAKPSPISATSALSRVAPDLARRTSGLFDDIWERPGLSKRDRSLIVVSSLISLNRTDQLGFHFQRALENGVTREELVEVVTHLAYYAGWPPAMSAVTVLDKVLNPEPK
jgi:4-carboxymuconolactone decarboxylase